MKVVERAEQAYTWCDRYRSAGLSIGLVPTMGALHAGHLSLVRSSRRECDRTAVSVFINPSQFGPNEDFAAYPRTPEDDLARCEDAGVDLVLMGGAEDMYPPGFQTWVSVEELTQPLCGASRPLHFRGVATVVSQLLNIFRPHRAYFGQKDYQQCVVIGRMARDLHFDVGVRMEPTVREADGLAMSSRNEYLSPHERQVGLRLSRALEAGAAMIAAGELSFRAVRDHMSKVLRPGDDLRLDYLDIRDAETLADRVGDAPLSGRRVVLAVAAFVGSTRLIDNVLVDVP